MAGKQKILIVDDDENIAELIELYLTKECFDTKIVNDGESALSVYETYEPNLILLDLMLPGIDGYQVCREIRSKNSTPIIMLSAKGEVFDKVLGLELGADDYMEKPFDSKELVARVKAVLRRCTAGKASEAPSSDAKVVEYPDLMISLNDYSAVIMLTYGNRDVSFIESLKELNIAPIALSYEYDPNDRLKAREYLLKSKNPNFKKYGE